MRASMSVLRKLLGPLWAKSTRSRFEKAAIRDGFLSEWPVTIQYQTVVHLNATGNNGRTPVVRGAITERLLLGLYYMFQNWTRMSANAAQPPFIVASRMGDNYPSQRIRFP